MEQEWFKEWFNTPYYHILYKNRDYGEASIFIDNLLDYLKPSPDDKFLDVACGKGRHSIYLNSKGYEVTGMDISANSIAEAKQHENERLHFFVADMRQTFDTEKYDIALNLFTSFGYFEDRDDNLKALQCIYKALKPGGAFVLDYFNIEKVLKSGVLCDEAKQIEGITFNIHKVLDGGKVKKKISFSDKGKEFSFSESVEAFTKDDFIAMFEKSGFSIQHIYGNYRLEEFNTSASDRLILAARK